jgi:hypothetical protein
MDWYSFLYGAGLGICVGIGYCIFLDIITRRKIYRAIDEVEYRDKDTEDQ